MYVNDVAAYLTVQYPARQFEFINVGLSSETVSGLSEEDHGGRFVLIGLQKEAISFSHPEFHKRETTLMSSRNATREDFEQVIDSIKKGMINPITYITHRVKFAGLKDVFETWLDPAAGVIKAITELD